MGRGPLAGPVVTCAVVMPLKKELIIEGITDSKKLSPKKREMLYEKIIETALDYEVEFVDEKIIDEINIPACNIEFEITESSVMENPDEAQSKISNLNSQGITFSIDDFGTGYSNFEYLMKLHADYIKIDGSMIKDINTNKNAYSVVEIIVDFAKKNNMKTIAEFVSTEEVFDTVKNLGVDYSQGYFIGKPKHKPTKRKV